MSVVVPCYNYGHFVGACVDSVVSQEGVDVDVLLIDDCSPDGSAEVLQDLADRFDTVRAICHTENRGHLATYNEGLSAVDGDFVLLLSADDLLAPGALGRAASAGADPSVGLVYGFAEAFTDTVPRTPGAVRSSTRTWSGQGWIRAVCRTAKNPVRTPAALVRRQAWESTGGYAQTLPHSADFFHWLEIATGWSVAYVRGPVQAYYRVHGANMHESEAFAGWRKDVELRKECLDLFFDEFGERLEQREQLQARSMRALARDTLRLARASERRGDVPHDAQAATSWVQALAPDVSQPWLPGAADPWRRRAEWHYWRRFGVFP